MRLLRRLLAVLAPALFAAGAYSQEGTVRILVGFPPGGGSDLIARLVADRIKGPIGSPVVVENRPGGTGILAAEALKAAAPDGRTLMVSPIAVTVFAPLTQPGLRYDPARDFAPVSLAANYDLALAVGPGTPARTLQEYIEWVRANPAGGAYGLPTAGGPPHFFGLMLARATGAPLTPVFYKGGPPLVTDLIGGQLPAAITSLADFTKQREAGRLRVLGTSGATRSRIAPDIPTFREAGYPQIEGSGWQAFHTVAGTPKATVERLAYLVAAALRSPEIAAKLLGAGLEPVGSNPEELATRMAQDTARWAPIVKASGFRIDQ